MVRPRQDDRRHWGHRSGETHVRVLAGARRARQAVVRLGHASGLDGEKVQQAEVRGGARGGRGG